MIQLIKSKLPSFKDSAFGWDGLTTFIVSNVLMVMTLGMIFFWLLFRVTQMAISAKTAQDKKMTDKPGVRIVLVAGLCLQHNQVTGEFQNRLDRAIALEHERSEEDSNNDRIIILGGLTADNQISEARAGADYLMRQGIAEKKIMLEDQSRHTLENMQHARTLLRTTLASGKQLPQDLIIVSSRYHLYRVLTLAKGLKMTLQAIAAEQSLVFSLPVLFLLIREAYYLHWYWSGKLWVFITANQKSQARIR